MCSLISCNKYLFPYREKIAGGQDCALFTNVFRYLNLQETTTGILVSKSWRTAITRTPILQNIIFDQFDFLSSLKNIREADYFLIGEKHDLPICKRLCAGMISCFSYDVPLIILVENPCNIRIKIEEYLKIMKLPLSLAQRVEVYGWDDSDYCEEVGILPPIRKSLETECVAIKNTIKNLKEILAIFPDTHEAVPLENILFSARKLLESHEKRLKKGDVTDEEITKTFPQRTKSMIRVLETVDNHIKRTKFRGKVIVQCGLAHVRTIPSYQNIKEYCLKDLYKCLTRFKFCTLHSKKIDYSMYELHPFDSFNAQNC